MANRVITTKVSKWGNGYGVRVPVAILESLSLSDESEVVITANKDSIMISPKFPSFAETSLEDLLKDVTPDLLRVRPDESDFFGKPQGREVW
jgi:antitoxin component of MazEF toxin-antitoxin module